MMTDEIDERYAELILQRPVYRFLQRFFLSEAKTQDLIIISPFITTLEGTRYTLSSLRDKIERERIPTYVITRKPEDIFQKDAIDLLKASNYIEIRFNDSLHAKLSVCRREDGGFALLGSGNLTRSSIEKNIEIGMIIHARGRGRELLHELFHWGAVRMRTLSESKLVKRMTYSRR